MCHADDSPLAAELRRAAAAYRARSPLLEPLADGFDRVAALERRLDKLESERALLEHVAAGGKLN